MHLEVLTGQYIIIFLNHLNHFKKLTDIKKLKEQLPGLCHVVSCRPPTTDAWVQSRACPGGIWGEQCDSDFDSSTWVYPCQYHSTNAPNSFTYHEDYTVSPIDSVVNITHFKNAGN
jgi:hypothetical protein